MRNINNNFIKELPFFYKSHNSKDNGGEKHTLPFQLYFDQNLSLFRQKSTEELNEVLKRVYLDGSLVDGSISSDSGKIYIPLLTKFILDHIDLKSGNKVLEIGCGSGVLLKELENNRKDLIYTGIDPGKHPLESDLDNIRIIRDFFPSKEVSDKFDLIYSFCVIEHIEEVETFIAQIKNQLAQNGKLIIGVPDCEPFLQNGDVSIFLHEHFNYFNKYSLCKLLREFDFKIESCEIIEGMIVLSASMNSISENISIANTVILQENFFSKALHIKDNFSKAINKYEPSDVAIYVPGRALNLLFLTNNPDVRLIDDNREMKGKYLPFLNNPIENFDILCEKAPKLIIVYSRIFGERIKQKIKNNLIFRDTLILTIEDLDA